MDPRIFDGLARHLATARIRRRAVGPLAGIASALFLSRREVTAGCKKVGRKCDKNKDCCDGAKCKGGKHGKCRCKSGRQDCDGDGKCENLNTDETNCGACGVVCIPPDACCDGVCSTACVL